MIYPPGMISALQMIYAYAYVRLWITAGVLHRLSTEFFTFFETLQMGKKREDFSLFMCYGDIVRNDK